jgi:phosphate:Na+ symporter
LAGLFSQLLAVTQVFGGLALFIFGMKEMSRGLQETAGKQLRALLQSATRSKVRSLGLGTTLGFFLHSSGASVLLVGFLNAGLITLTQAIPVIFGANIGTTLSMQAVSFKLSNFSYIAIAIGLAATFTKHSKAQSLGRSLFGFGLLFLGMEIMSQGVFPYREALRPVLQRIDGTALSGMLAGVLLATLVTAVIQSSGATIGMAFALVSAGVFESLSQTMPIILGAHIGTCATAMLASIGTQSAARRAALSHLLFNIFNVVICIIFRAPLIRLLESMTDDVVRQTANLHTVAMVGATVLLMPALKPFTALILRMTPTRKPEPEPSFLTPDAMEHLETALPAIRLEIARLLRMTCGSIERNRQLLEAKNPEAEREIHLVEEAIDSIKVTMIQALRDLARDEIDREHLPEIDEWTRCIIEVERIGDHLNTLRKLSAERNNEPAHTLFGRELTHQLNRQFASVREILGELEALFLTDDSEFYTRIDDILRKRVALLESCMNSREMLSKRLAENRIPPKAMFFLSSYLEIFERIARHAQILAVTSPVPPGVTDPAEL